MNSDYDTFVRECITRMSENAEIKSDIIALVLETMREVGGNYVIEKINGFRPAGTEDIPPEIYEYLSACEVEGQSKATINGKRYTYKLFFNLIRKPLSSIDVSDARKFLSYFKQDRGASDVTLERVRMQLNALFKWLYIEEQIPRNFMEKIRPIRYEKKQRAALDRCELETLRSACENAFETALVDIMFTTGCRVSEVTNMKLADIDWTNNTIQIHNGKWNKERYVVFSDRAKISLQAYISRERCGESPYVFVSRVIPYQKFQDTESVSNVLKSIASRTNIAKPITPHIMRHTFATLAHQNGMPLEELQVLMGHESIDTTRIYAEIDDESIRRSHARFVV